MPGNRKIGATIALDGEQKFKQAVTSVNKELGTMKSEMSSLKEKTAGHANSLDALRAKNDILVKSLEKSKEKQEAVRAGLQNAQQRYEKAAAEVEDYRKEIEKEESALEELKKSGEASTEEIESREKAIQSMKEADEQNRLVLAKAKDSVEEWTQKLNRSEVEVSKASKAVDENSQYMAEAERSADNCATSIDGFGKKTSSAKQELASMDQTIRDVAGSGILIHFLEGAAEAAKKLAKATYEAAKELDDGYDAIITKTGASGKALEEMQDIADNVFSSMPVEMADVGNAVGEVNKRFHSMGEELEDTSKIFLQFAEINGANVSSSVDKTDRIMKAFGVDASEVKNVLGLFTKVGQDTSLTMDTLMGTLDKNGASFRELGFNLESSAQMLAEFEANGVDTNGVLAALKKGVVNAAKEGKDANSMLSEAAAAIVNAKTETEALQIATETFGSKGAMVMVDGLRSGRVSLQETGTSLKSYGDIVEKTFEETLDPWDDAKIAMNNLKAAGSTLAGEAMQELKPAINTVTEAIKGVTKWFRELDEPQKKAIAGFAGLAAGAAIIVPKTIALAKGIEMIRAAHALSTIATNASTAATATNTVATEGATVAQAAFNAVLSANPIALAVIAVAGLTAAIIYLTSKSSESQTEMEKLTDDMYSAKTASEEARKSMESAGDKLTETYTAAKGSIDDTLASSELVDRLAGELFELSEKTSRTAEEQTRMKAIVSMLNDIYPDLALSIDETTGNLNQENAEILANIENLKKMAMAKAYQEAYEEAIRAVVDAQKAQIKSEMELEKVQDGLTAADREREKILGLLGQKQTRLQTAHDKYVKVLNNSKASVDDVIAAETEYQAALADSQNDQIEYNGKIQSANKLLEELASAQGTSTEEVKKATEAIEENKGKVDDALEYTEELMTRCEEMGVSVTGVAEATDGATESLEGATEATGALGEQTGETAEELAEDAEEITATYAELYEKALESINGQIGLFEQMALDSEVSLQSMNEALISQQEVMSNYSQNLARAMEYVSSSGDENAAAFVQSIADMGADGASYMDAFVKALEADDGSAEEILSNFANAQAAKEQYAAQMAQMETQTGTSATAMVDAMAGAEPEMGKAADATAQAGVKATQEAETGYRDAGAQNARAEAEGIESETGTVSSASETLNSAAEDVLSSTDAYSWGSHLGNDFADGIRSQASAVASAAQALANAAAQYIHHTTPDKGPLAGDDKWGGELAEQFAKTMAAKTGQVGRAAEGIAKAAADGMRKDATSRDISLEASVKNTSGGAGKNAQDKIIVENRFYLGDRDITELITKKVVKKVTEMQRAASIAKGSAYV